MPWLLNPGALRRLRRAKQFTRREAAQRTGLNEWTIHRHETPELAPRHLHHSTVRIYATAYECAKEDFVRWVEVDDQTASAPIAPSSTQALPVEVSTSHGMVRLLDAAILRKYAAACGLHEGKRFAVSGRIVDYDELQEITAGVLGVPFGEGAVAQFLREGGDGQLISITVHTRVGEHTLSILECADTPREITVVVRLLVKPPGTAFKGFRILGTRRGRAPFALVVEEILPTKQDADFPTGAEKSE